MNIDRSVTTPRGTWSSEIDIDRSFGEIDIDRDVKFKPNENVYDRQEQAKGKREERPADREGRRAGTEKDTTRYDKSKSGQRQNNVLSDRSGNVYRKTESGWQQRDRNSWSRPDTSTRTSSSRSSFQQNRSSMDRQYKARSRGTQRTSNYQRSNYSRSSSRSGVSRSGGGGRGRR